MKENLQDAEAIAEKVLWFLRLSPQELMAHFAAHRDDAFHYIPDPTRNMVFIGQEGTRRFRAIARRFLHNQSENRRRTDRQVFVDCLKLEFHRRFVQAGESLDADRVQGMISAAFRDTEKSFSALRHYVPCAIFYSENFPEIVVGPVRFTQTDQFLKAKAEALAAHRERGAGKSANGTPEAEKVPASEDSSKTPKPKSFSDAMVDRVISHFGDYGWIAEVDVPACSPKVSYDHALSLTRAALNVLKLILGRHHTYRVRTAEDRGHAPKSAKLSRGENGNLQISALNTPDQNVLGDECLEALAKDFPIDLRQATVVLTHAAGFADPPPLCRRFLDALAWYGDAVNEPSAAARIIKFVTAIEAMCGTGPERDAQGKEIRGVTEIVTGRAGIWLQDWLGGSLAGAQAHVAKIYGWRSGLVHGSLSPFDEDMADFSRTTEEATRRILLTGLDYFTSLGIADPQFTMRPLREKFRELEKNAEETETNGDSASKT